MTPRDRATAGRYARAFFEAAQGEKATAALLADLIKAGALLEGDVSLQLALRHPRRKPEEHVALLEKTLGPFQPFSRRALTVLFRHKRGGLLPQVARRFRALEETSRGVTAVSATSVTPLSAEVQAQISAKLGRVLGGGVRLETHLQPELLGGLRLQIGDKLWDHSLRDRLEQWREQIRVSHGA